MIDWRQIRHVLLDMDGTLLDLHFDNHFWQELVPRRYAQGRGLDVITAKAVLYPLFRRSEGTLNWYCLDHWTRELKIDIATLKKEAAHLIAIQPNVIEFLDALRAAGKRGILVTNAHPKSLALKLEHTRLDEHLEAIVSAHDVGHPKENAAFWGALQRMRPFAAAHTLLIDDNLSVLRSARQYGIKYLLAIHQPDTRRPPRDTGEFAALRDFRDILPLPREM
jgi:HAD superfamily hydrolase (TIGR01509 family)